MSPLPRRPILLLYQLATGRHILRRLDELNRTQWLTRDQLMRLQRRRLHRLLCYAYEHVPYYHQLFDQHGFNPGEVLTDMSGFHRLPILTKAIIREDFDALLTTDIKDRARLMHAETSGSTGHPLAFMKDPGADEYGTADGQRHLGWAGWKLGDVHCFLSGTHGEATASRKLRTKFKDWTFNRFETNAFLVSDETMAAFAAVIRRRHPRILVTYPASAYRFAQFLSERQINDIQFDAIFSFAEMIHPEQRRVIEEVFGGKVFNMYATREFGGISCECDAHIGMHVSVENNYVEILKDGQPAQPGEIGDVIVTNLHNHGMPFIRYSLEDLGSFSTNDSCPCGRELPMMDLTQARRIDVLRTRNGQAGWGGLSDVFCMKEIKHFQIVQKSFDLLVLRIVKDRELSQAQLNSLERTAKTILGQDVEVRFEFPNEIPVLESGKHRFVVCEIEDEPRVGSRALEESDV